LLKIVYTLFDNGENEDKNKGNPAPSDALMQALDGINRWHMRQQFKSPSYTTQWAELLVIGI